MKKIFSTLLLMVVLVTGLCACGGTKELSDAFDASVVETASKELVGYINEDDAEAFCAVPMSDKMKEVMTVESLSDIFEQYLGNKGAFVEYKNIVIVGADDKEIGDCAIAVVSAKYENMTVTYTISYDTSMNLIGFYLK